MEWEQWKRKLFQGSFSDGDIFLLPSSIKIFSFSSMENTNWSQNHHHWQSYGPLKKNPNENPSLTVEPIPKPGRPKRNSNMSVILFGRSILGICLDKRPCLRFILQRVFSFFFFFFFQAATFDQFSHGTIHGSHKLHFSATFSLQMGPTALFTHLKFILL